MTTQKQNAIWFPLLTLILANSFIAVVYLFLVKGFNYTFIKNGEPTFALSGTIILWVTFGMLILMGLVPYFLFNLSNFKTDRTGLKKNYCWYYWFMLMVLLWAFFSFTLKLPIVGCIILGIAIAEGIYTTYRFMTNSICSGVLLSVFNMWLIYLFILNLAYILL